MFPGGKKPMMDPNDPSRGPDGAPMDDSSLKMSLLDSFMKHNAGKSAVDMKSKYLTPPMPASAPSPADAMAEPNDPTGADDAMPAVAIALGGQDGTASPMDDKSDPHQLLKILESDAVRKLLGNDQDLIKQLGLG